VKITARTALTTIAFRVGDALRRAGIDVALTGGSCAMVHSGGDYRSLDIDFVLRFAPTVDAIDQVMRRCGYLRDGHRYRHPTSAFFVEFVEGPVAVGNDAQVVPVELRAGTARILALSPTDACRDRLAAYYHWRDQSSLQAAVAIARRERVDLPLIERWSETEGARRGFERFRADLAASRPHAAPRATHRAPRPHRSTRPPRRS
jgi:hypothetical protein